MNQWFLGVSTSLIAGAISWSIASWHERRRELNRIYDAVAPVIKELAAQRRDGLISGEHVQSLVQTISTSLGSVYAGGSDRLSEYRNDDLIGTIRPQCGVCGLPPTVNRLACANCKLNCCAWNFPA